MQETISIINFSQGISDKLDDDVFFDVKKTDVLMLDDITSLASKDLKITDLLTEGLHHRNLAVVNFTQYLFPPG